MNTLLKRPAVTLTSKMDFHAFKQGIDDALKPARLVKKHLTDPAISKAVTTLIEADGKLYWSNNEIVDAKKIKDDKKSLELLLETESLISIDALLLNYIKACVHPGIHPEINKCETALAAYAILETTYGQVNEHDFDRLQDEIDACKFRSGNIDIHINKLRAIFQRYEDGGRPLTTKTQTRYLLSSLQPEDTWATTRRTIRAQPNLKMSEIIDIIRDEATEVNKTPITDQGAYHAREHREQPRNRYRDKGKGDREFTSKFTSKFTGKCHSCGKQGHKMSECKKKQHTNDHMPSKAVKVCTYCKKRYHTEDVCKSKQRDQARGTLATATTSTTSTTEDIGLFVAFEADNSEVSLPYTIDPFSLGSASTSGSAVDSDIACQDMADFEEETFTTATGQPSPSDTDEDMPELSEDSSQSSSTGSVPELVPQDSSSGDSSSDNEEDIPTHPPRPPLVSTIKPIDNSAPDTKDNTFGASPEVYGNPVYHTLNPTDRALVAFFSNNPSLLGKWLLDSGASHTMTHDKALLKNYRPIDRPIDIVIADSRRLKVEGIGDIDFTGMVGTKHVKGTMKDVYHVPHLAMNLYSPGAAVKRGAKLSSIFDMATMEGNLFVLNIQCTAPALATASTVVDSDIIAQGQQLDSEIPVLLKADSIELLHYRLGHLNEIAIRRAVGNGLIKGLAINTNGKHSLDTCPSCLAGRQTRAPFRKNDVATRATEVLGLVHSDVSGPMRTLSPGGARYTLTYTDDLSKYTHVYFLKHKNEQIIKFRQFKAAVELLTGKKIKILRTDGGGEYVNREMANELAAWGIIHQTTTAYTPESNGVSERRNRTNFEPARTMLFHAGLPPEFWAEAYHTANYLKNRSPSRAVPTTPHEVFHGTAPSGLNLRVFGCLCHVHVPATKRAGKLASRSRPCIFIGYSDTQKGWRVYDPETKQTYVSRDVIFQENIKGSVLLSKNHNTGEFTTNAVPSSWIDQYFEEEEDVVIDTVPANNQDSDSEEVPDLSRPPHQVPAPILAPAPPLAPAPALGLPPKRVIKGTSSKYRASAATVSDDPDTLKEALSGPDAEDWRAAVHEELNAIEALQVWELVPLPAGRKPIGTKYVFKKKRDAKGNVTRYKVRLTAKGYAQIPGVDFFDTYAPVVRFDSLRALLAFAAISDYEIDQIDVTTAFLYSDLEEEIYVKQPELYVVKGKENWVLRLLKALYGLKQSNLAWFNKIMHLLCSRGWEPSDADPCLLVKEFIIDGITFKAYICMYVDDSIIAAPTRNIMKLIKEDFASLKITDNGPVHHVLNLEVTRDRSNRRLWISQRGYIDKILKTYRMEDCKPSSTPAEKSPMIPVTDLSDSDKVIMDTVPYRGAVGSLLYAAVATRPDIAAAVGAVSRYMTNPGPKHWTAVKRIIRYLQGTKDLAICYSPQDSPSLNVYTDADWGGDLDTRRSTSGYISMFAGGPISWRSVLQKIIALSTCEAEYIALCLAAQESIWLQRLLDTFGIITGSAIMVHEDNQGAIDLAINDGHHARTKHIDIRYHFIRYHVQAENIKIVHCPTARQIADVLTKPLTRAVFTRLIELMGMRDVRR